MVNISDYTKELVCEYKGETYHVRDNGAIMRCAQPNKPIRKKDNVWTFGDTFHNGYLRYCNESVHRIVCTAFNGPAPTDQHVVDHIDTNRQNNRPENLRWLTKLENILNNEITRKKIEWICGSVENFLLDPSQLRGYEQQDRNFEWMKSVTKEEAANTLRNWKLFLSRSSAKSGNGGAIGSWIFEDSKFQPMIPVKTPEQLEEERMVEEKRVEEEKLKKMQERAETAKKKRQEANEKKRLEAEKKKNVLAKILAIADSCGWLVEQKKSGNGWKTDVLLVSADIRIGIKLYSSTRDVLQELSAMKDDGIIGCCLGNAYPYSNLTDSGLFPCFELEVSDDSVSVVVSDAISISMEEYLQAMISGRFRVKDEIIINKINVRFVPVECYFCKAQHYVYFVDGLISNEMPELNSKTYLHNACATVKELDPILVSGVLDYLAKHPELNITMGEIKTRYSKTQNEPYMSFGCPSCDGLFGEWFFNDLKLDCIYDTEYEVHEIDLGEKGITLPIKHWILI